MITVDWYNDEQTLALWRFESEWTVAETLGSFEDFHAMIAGVDHPYNVLIDFTPSGRIPPHLITIFSRLASILNEQPNRPDRIAIVVQGDKLAALAQVFEHATGRRFARYTEFEEALDALRDLQGSGQTQNI